MATSKKSAPIVDETIDTTKEVEFVDTPTEETITVKVNGDSIVTTTVEPTSVSTGGHGSRDFFTPLS